LNIQPYLWVPLSAGIIIAIAFLFWAHPLHWRYPGTQPLLRALYELVHPAADSEPDLFGR
jgi:hypothetical protein